MAADSTHEAAELAMFCDAWEAGGLPETIAATADAARDGEAPGMRRRKLTVTQLRAVLARNAELEAENARMRARLAELTALADELQVATAQNRAANAEWLDLRFGGPDDAAALRATDERMIETQARRNAAQQAWMRAATRYATLDERFASTKPANAIVLVPDAAPQQPAHDGSER
jgi:hypothetical protein